MDKEQLRRRAEHTICEGCEARDLLIGRLEARCARYREALEKIAGDNWPEHLIQDNSKECLQQAIEWHMDLADVALASPSPKQREEVGKVEECSDSQ